MIRKNTSPHIEPVQGNGSVLTDNAAHLTIFAIPKPFEGHVATIQNNAIRSWARLRPHVEIVLFGQDDPGLDEIAREVDARLLPLRTNDNGTPLLSDAFQQVHSLSSSGTLCYVNSDIVFGTGLLDIVSELQDSDLGSYLGIGRRTDLDVDDEVDMRDLEQVNELFTRARDLGVVSSVVCKDYFVFPSSIFRQIPDFLVGRGNWDNWMVANAKSRQIPVVDLSERLPVIHQNHDYSHIAGGRKSAYISGTEARLNQRLAGGRKLIVGSTADWGLTEKGPKRRLFPMFAMIRDLPRFVWLLRNLLFLGYIMASSPL